MMPGIPLTALTRCFIITSTLFCGVLPVGSANAQETLLTFRNAEYKFRFTYPSDWRVATPRGENIRASVTHQTLPLNCNVLIRRVPELEAFSQKDIDNDAFSSAMSVADWKEMMGDKYSDFRVLERRLTKVDNRPAQYAAVSFSYETVMAKIFAQQLILVRMTPGLYWQFLCGAAGRTNEEAQQNLKNYNQVLIRIMSSWVFENW